jgi:hypothetical protein
MYAYHAPSPKDFIEVRDTATYEMIGFIKRPYQRPYSDRLELPVRQSPFAFGVNLPEQVAVKTQDTGRVVLTRQTFYCTGGGATVQGEYDAYFVSKQEWDRLNPVEFVI